MEATDVKVGLAQLLSATATATAAIAEGSSGGVAAAAVAVVVGAWWSHLVVGGRHIRLLQNRMGRDQIWGSTVRETVKIMKQLL